MTVSELEGAKLDLWVARAEGKCHTQNPGEWGMAGINELGRLSIAKVSWDCARYFEPSKNWAHAGPIIERERPELIPCWPVGGWYARSRHRPCDGDQYYGETALIAAMRAYVASKYGDEVPAE
ncbi:phage protein NinX family protein [Cupriavidus sp. YAF13]|uniref:phage protein NinX family protein n=1 Tax=Cupriavidus sp. YAF13 TaxID=3233075 RepID=UPI003F8F1839